jgi:hypothetical protein
MYSPRSAGKLPSKEYFYMSLLLNIARLPDFCKPCY